MPNVLLLTSCWLLKEDMQVVLERVQTALTCRSFAVSPLEAAYRNSTVRSSSLLRGRVEALQVVHGLRGSPPAWPRPEA